MLAILVLAAITAIAFSLASIVFIEIRSAGDNLRTEPALYATFGVTEEALFQYKRFYSGPFDVPSCQLAANHVCDINGVTLTLPGTQPIAFDESPRVENIARGTTETFPLYLINNYNQQYTLVKIEVLPNEANLPVMAYFKLTKADGTQSNTTERPVSPDTSWPYSSFESTGQYELVLRNPSTTQDIAVSLTTKRVNDQTPEGLPYVGEQVLRIMANYLGLTRTYQVRIPIP